MPVVVTENWSGYRMSYKPPWNATREFVVTGVTSGSAALVAVDANDSSKKIPREKEEHPEGAALLCAGPEIKERKGTDYWVIACSYGLDDGKIEAVGGDPLNIKPTYTWEHVEVSEQVDVDLDGRPILNTAGFPLDGACRPVVYKRLHVVRNEPSWNVSRSIACENAVNDAIINLGNGVQIAKQHMRCASITPDGSYTAGFRFLPMHYIFEVIFDDSLGAYPFQHRFLDLSTQGWYSDSGTKRSARFSNGKGELMDEAVRLDGTGLPLLSAFTNVKVGQGNAAAVVPPKEVNVYANEYYKNGVKQAALSGADATILYFKRTRVVDLSVLGL